MADVVLDNADLALWSNVAGTRVVIPRLQAFALARGAEKAFVRFEGDTRPTAFSGEGRSDTYQMTGRYLTGEHASMAALLDLFDAADDDPDGRLMLRTHLGEVGSLNAVEAVVATDITVTSGDAGVFDVAWTAHVVEFTLEA